MRLLRWRPGQVERERARRDAYARAAVVLGLRAIRCGNIGTLTPSRGAALAADECPAGRPSSRLPGAVAAFVELPASVMAVVEEVAAAGAVAPAEGIRTAANLGAQILAGETNAGLPAEEGDAVRIALGAATAKRAVRGARGGSLG